jgi:septation ring formation regulator EzrA
MPKSKEKERPIDERLQCVVDDLSDLEKELRDSVFLQDISKRVTKIANEAQAITDYMEEHVTTGQVLKEVEQCLSRALKDVKEQRRVL